jgi:hypothetical protein
MWEGRWAREVGVAGSELVVRAIVLLMWSSGRLPLKLRNRLLWCANWKASLAHDAMLDVIRTYSSLGSRSWDTHCRAADPTVVAAGCTAGNAGCTIGDADRSAEN